MLVTRGASLEYSTEMTRGLVGGAVKERDGTAGLRDKPYALIGGNVGGDAKNLKGVVRKENLTWRSFADPGDVGHGPIAARWNLTNTSTPYVLDPRGVIRYKWFGGPGEKAIDAALEKLLKELEAPR
jgi:hypothetical protein